jgi:hypothetical protein
MVTNCTRLAPQLYHVECSGQTRAVVTLRPKRDAGTCTLEGHQLQVANVLEARGNVLLDEAVHLD